MAHIITDTVLPVTHNLHCLFFMQNFTYFSSFSFLDTTVKVTIGISYYYHGYDAFFKTPLYLTYVCELAAFKF